MTHWWKKYGDKGRAGTCWRTTTCLTIHKSHPHKYMYVFIISKSFWPHLESHNHNTHYSLKTPHVEIFMWVWFVDSCTWGCSWTCSIPTLSPYFFQKWVIPSFPEMLLKFFNVLVCLPFWWPLATWNRLEFATTSINTHSYIFAVLYV